MEKTENATSGKAAATQKSGIVIARQFNPAYSGYPGIVNVEPSMTEPDRTYSIAELLANHTRGLSNDQYREGEYFGDEEIPVFEDHLLDPIAYKESLLERKKEVEERLAELEIESENRKNELKGKGKAPLEPGKETQTGGEPDPVQSPLE